MNPTHAQHIGPYALLEPLGSGGMGKLYLARREDRSSEVVLKTVRTVKRTAMTSIRAEICALAEIEQPGIVRILEYGVHRGVPWYTMELIEGHSLRSFLGHHTAPHRTVPTERMTSARMLSIALSQEVLVPATSRMQAPPSPSSLTWNELDSERERRHPISVTLPVVTDEDEAIEPSFQRRYGERLGIVRGVCHALSHLHAAGLVHCDLKPENIMVRPNGVPTLLDFGLAIFTRGGTGHETLTMPQKPAGSLAYMAPEQFEHGFIDARADIYALGCLLYEILTGHTPFRGTSSSEYHQQHRHREVPPPSRFCPQLPAALEMLVLKMLAKHPADRPGYIVDVAAALKPYTSEDPLPSSPAAPYLFRPSFAGRHGLRGDLRSALTSLKMQREGGLILVSGAAGTGKTRLALELAHEGTRRGLTVISPDPLPDAFEALGPIHNASQHFNYIWQERGSLTDAPEHVQHAARVIAVHDTTLAHLEGVREHPEPEPLPPRQHMRRLYNAILAVFGYHASHNPVVLLLDDLDEVDNSTLGWLRTFAHSAQAAPLLIVGFLNDPTRLQSLLGEPDVEHHTLDNLDPMGVRVMICSMLAILDPPTALVERVFFESQGNPSAVALALHHAVERGALSRERGQWTYQT